MVKIKKAELLAPAGSFESLQAAMNAGANAVYFGVEQLNVRTRSSPSFTLDDIKEISARCKAAGIKAYITLNTVMYEHDMRLLKTILKELKKIRLMQSLLLILLFWNIAISLAYRCIYLRRPM